MRKQRLTRTVGVITTLAVMALTFEFVGTGGGGGLTAGAATVSYTCDGITGDNTGSLGDSKALVGALKSFAKISSLQLPLNIVVQAPTEVEKGSKPFQVRIGIGIQFDPSLTKSIKETLGKSTLGIQNAQFSFVAENGGTTIAGKLPNQTISVDSPPPVQFLTGTVDPKNAGLISYLPGSARISVVINGAVAGQTIGTMTLDCRVPGGDAVGYTAVRIPGAPRVAPISVQGHGGVDLFQLLGKGYIKPDQGNPVLPDTLKMLGQPAGGGFSAYKNGWVGILNAYSGGNYRIPMEVCAASIPVPAVPGNSEIQKLTILPWGGGGGINAHPLGFSLKVGNQETTTFRTSKFRYFDFQPWTNSQLVGENWLNLMNFAHFFAPTAAEVQKALEQLPSVGIGNVRVTLGPVTAASPYAPYQIEYVGALAEANMPDITIGKWYTHANYADKAAIFDLANSLSEDEGGAGGGPTLPTEQQLQQWLLTGQFNLWSAGVAAVLSAGITGGITGGINVPQLLGQIAALFPEPPAPELVRNGKATVPATETGILCTPFQVAVETPPNQLMMFYQALEEQIRAGKFNTAVAGSTLCKVRVAKRVRVRSRGRTRIVKRYVTKEVPCKKKVVKKRRRR